MTNGEKVEELEKHMKSLGACGKNCGWITTSLLAGFTMGTGSFIYAANYTDYGMVATGILGPGGFVIFFVLKVLREIVYRCKTGTWVKPIGESAWLKNPSGKIKWSSITPILGTTACTVGRISIMTYAWGFADQAGLNQGVISSLFSFMALFDCIVFYFAFGEKVSKLHLIGIIIMFLGLACIGAAAATKESEDIDEDIDTGGRSVFLNGILAIVVGLGGPITMALQHYIVRRFS